MKEMTANIVRYTLHVNKYLIFAMILAGAILIGVLATRGQEQPEAAVAAPAMTTISQSALEEQYGLHINLVAVTAAGGLVDVRLKILDAEKAQALLGEGTPTPSLWIEASDTTLAAAPGTHANLQLEDGTVIFLQLPNVRNAVKPGTPVDIQFGDLRVEAMAAQ